MHAAVWNNSVVQKLVYSVGAFIALLIVVGLLLPARATVSATVRIDTHAATVFALVNDFRRVRIWSPMLETDPNARVIFSGPERGVDAAMTWDGTIIGTGLQVITASRPFEYVETAINPGVRGAARSWFDFDGGNGQTVVTWTFEADYGYNLVGRYFALLVKGVVKRDQALGLATLKELAESLPAADFSNLEIERIVIESTDIAYLATSSIPEPASMSTAMGDAYFEILTFIDQHGLQDNGAPLSIMRSFSGSQLLFDSAIPVRGLTDATPRDGKTVKIGKTYAGDVIRVTHVGSYRTLSTTHRRIAAYLAALGIERNGDAWESYVSDPTRVAESDLLTYVYYPVRAVF